MTPQEHDLLINACWRLRMDRETMTRYLRDGITGGHRPETLKANLVIAEKVFNDRTAALSLPVVVEKRDTYGVDRYTIFRDDAGLPDLTYEYRGDR